MNLLRTLTAANCEVVQNGAFKEWNNYAEETGLPKLTKVEDLFTDLKIEVFDNGEIWFSAKDFEEQRSYTAEKNGIITTHVEELEIDIQIDKEELLILKDKKALSEWENGAPFDDEGIHAMREKYDDHKFKCVTCGKRKIDISDFNFKECIKCELQSESKSGVQ